MIEQKDVKQALIPKLRFPEFKDAGEWKAKPLMNFLTESRTPGNTGLSAKKITVKLWGKGVFSKEESMQGSENTRYYKRRAGQFIYSKLDFLNQAFGIIPPELDGFESTVDLPCFDISQELDPTFLLRYVEREDFYKKNGEIADGGRKARRIQTEVFLSFSISIPPNIKEQEKIASCLSSIGSLIATENKKLSLLKIYRKGLMQQLFPRRGEAIPQVRFPDFRDAEEWKQEKLEELARRGSGHTPSKENPDYYGGGIKWVSLADSKKLDSGLISDTEIEISEQGIKNSSAVLHPKGTVIMSRDAGVGKSAILSTSMAVSQHFIAWVCNSKQLLNWFLYYELQRNKPVFEKIANGSTIKTIGVPFFIELQMNLPSLHEQQKIADILLSLDALISTQNEKISFLEIHRKSLIQKLFPSLKEVRK